MLRGFHFIFSAYGFWLPNDPRGSWSETIRRYELITFGPATKTTSTRSVAHRKHDHAHRIAAKRALKFPPVRFTGEQAQHIAKGFDTACEEAGYTPRALAILPDHTHLVLAWHPRPIDDIAKHLKAKATTAMSHARIHPLQRFADSRGHKPSPWARRYWCPFIHTDRQLDTVLRYVEDNPVKAGLRPQLWSMVTRTR